MKYPGLPAGMWTLFAGSFRRKLTEVLGYDRAAAAEITRKAHGRYRALMGELGLGELVPAMCRLDYTMSEAGGADVFTRRYTLASGGPYNDHRMEKTIDFSIVFSTKRYVLRRMIL